MDNPDLKKFKLKNAGVTILKNPQADNKFQSEHIFPALPLKLVPYTDNRTPVALMGNALSLGSVMLLMEETNKTSLPPDVQELYKDHILAEIHTTFVFTKHLYDPTVSKAEMLSKSHTEEPVGPMSNFFLQLFSGDRMLFSFGSACVLMKKANFAPAMYPAWYINKMKGKMAPPTDSRFKLDLTKPSNGCYTNNCSFLWRHPGHLQRPTPDAYLEVMLDAIYTAVPEQNLPGITAQNLGPISQFDITFNDSPQVGDPLQIHVWKYDKPCKNYKSDCVPDSEKLTTPGRGTTLVACRIECKGKKVADSVIQFVDQRAP